MLYKNYGGIDWFSDKPIFLLVQCLENVIEKEQAIPKLIDEIIATIFHRSPSFNPVSKKKKMRSREEIMRDYGLE